MQTFVIDLFISNKSHVSHVMFFNWNVYLPVHEFKRFAFICEKMVMDIIPVLIFNTIFLQVPIKKSPVSGLHALIVTILSLLTLTP